MAWSISSSVVHQPTLKRKLASIFSWGSLMAFSTWLSPPPLVQADPTEKCNSGARRINIYAGIPKNPPLTLLHSVSARWLLVKNGPICCSAATSRSRSRRIFSTSLSIS